MPRVKPYVELRQQVKEAGEQERALTHDLMGTILCHSNIKQAYKQVKQNKGVAGIDQMPVGEFAVWYVEDGRIIVIDMDLKTFFDVVNHDRLMYRLSTTIGDKTLLGFDTQILAKWHHGWWRCKQRTEGTLQGSPLSPLLSNIVLDELDKELERRGHKFVRYADDCNIYVRSHVAGERVMESVSNFIENKLKLIVNREKSQVCEVNQTKFLGYTIQKDGNLSIAKKSVERFKEKVRNINQAK